MLPTITLRHRLTPTAFRGEVNGQPALIKLAPEGGPLSDRASMFFGGQGLISPYRPLVFFEADCWQRVEPERVLSRGLLDGSRPYVALAWLDGAPLTPTDDPAAVEALLRQLASAVHRLHSVGIIHRDLRPDHVLVVDGAAVLLDLDLALLDGLGVRGPVGSVEWQAPEQRTGQGDHRVDLYALGRIVSWFGGSAPLRAPLRALLGALCALDPAHRPRSAASVLRMLGDEVEDALPISTPLPEPDALQVAGGEALSAAVQGGSWEVVARCCSKLGEQLRPDAALFRAQAAEARWRARLPHRRRQAIEHLQQHPRDPAGWPALISHLTPAERGQLPQHLPGGVSLRSAAVRALLEVGALREAAAVLGSERTWPAELGAAALRTLSGAPSSNHPEALLPELMRPEPWILRAVDAGLHGESASLRQAVATTTTMGELFWGQAGK